MQKKLIIIVLIAFLFPKEMWAADAVLTAPERACEDFIIDFYNEEENRLNEDWKMPAEMNSSVYEEHLEKTKDAYHHYIACLFAFAENTVYGSDASYQEGMLIANLQNTNVIDWMAPNDSCLDPTELNKIVHATTPTQMLGPILEAHADYKRYLGDLLVHYADHGLEVDGAGNPTGGSEQLLAKVDFLDQAERNIQMELDSSMVSIDLMLHSLKELRTSFVLHVHFQCTLKYLDKYRQSLEKLRKLIEPLPGQLRDASITK